MKVHAKSGSPEPYGFGQEDFKNLFSRATRAFIRIKFFERILMKALAEPVL